MIQTLEWTDQGVRFIDQTKLPTEEIYVTCTTYQQVADVIRNMVVRGAPAIGVAPRWASPWASRTPRQKPPETSKKSSTRSATPSAKPGQPRSTSSGPFDVCRKNSSASHPPHAADQAEPYRRSPAHARRRHRRESGDGTPWSNADAAQRRSAHPLQRRRAGHRRIRYGSWQSFAPPSSRARKFTSMPMKHALSCRVHASLPGS